MKNHANASTIRCIRPFRTTFHAPSRRCSAGWLGALVLACAASLSAQAQSTIGYNFGAATPNAGPTSGTQTNFTAGSFTLGNSLGTVTTPINTTSAPAANTYTIPAADGGGSNSSGENLGNAVKTGALDTATSAYYSVTITAAAGFTLQITDFDFASRSTSTGPTTFTLRSSLDNFGSDLFTPATALANSAFTFKDNPNFTLNSTVSGGPVELRLYTYGGTGSAGSGTQNNRIDDVFIKILAVAAGGGGPTPNYFDTNGSTAGIGINGGNAAVFDIGTANFTPTADGTGTPKVFDNTQVGIFGGTSGAVTVSAVTANAGIQFIVSSYTFNGGTLTLGTVPTVEVTNLADTATINSMISGTAGLTKTGAGTLVLGSTTSDFTGNVSVSAGTLSISSEANLGNAANDIVLGGTFQATNSISLNNGRDLSGTGSIDIGPGNTLTFNGAVNTGGVTLVNSGTVATAGTAVANKTVGAVTFSAAGTLANTNDTLSVANITTTQAAGTATISGPVSFGAATRTLTVADGTATVDLLLSGNLSGAATLAKLGAGTLQLTGDNSFLTGSGTTPASVRIGTAGATPVTGGIVAYTTATALGGVGAGAVVPQIQFNGGTLRNDAAGPLVVANGFSIGAQDAAATPGGAVFSGSNTEFQGAVSIFRATGTTLQQAITVNNTTTFSGVFSTLTSAQGGGSGTSTGITIGGTGRLVLAGAAPNTFTEPLVVASPATLGAAKNGALAANASITVNNGGTLLLSGTTTAGATPGGVSDRVGNTVPISLGGGSAGLSGAGPVLEGTAISRNAGTTTPSPYQSGSATSVTGLGALTLTANSTLAFNGIIGTAVFSSFAPGSFVLNITGYTNSTTASTVSGIDGTDDRLVFATDQSANITAGAFAFNGSTAGVGEVALGDGYYEIVAVPEPATVLGGLLMLGALGWSQRRRLGSLLARGTVVAA